MEYFLYWYLSGLAICLFILTIDLIDGKGIYLEDIVIISMSMLGPLLLIPSIKVFLEYRSLNHKRRD